ncbi:MAG: S41 family peptidase [Phycisphaerales bacterium JB039]
MLVACASAVAQLALVDVYEEACAIVAREFVDPDLNGLDWEAECAARRGRAAEAESAAELAPVLNELLGLLETSHTAFYPRGSRAWGELLDIFHSDGVPADFSAAIEPGIVESVSIGVVTCVIDGRVFAADVYDGSPAAEAGLLVGDEIVSAGGARWTDDLPLPGAPGEALEILIRRERAGDPTAITVTPELIRPKRAFMRAQEASTRVIERNGAQVGYIRLRSYAHPDFHDQVKGQVRFGALKDADALVLDLRGGWGGANVDYLDFLFPVLPAWEMRRRDGDWVRAEMAWRKPLVVLIDEGSRSGKEVVAHTLKKHGLATLVGARTGGMVVGGRPFPLADGSLLYVAVMDVRIDGDRLEGVGVAPDVEVRFELPYAAGTDPQLEVAVEEAARQASR